MPVYSESERGTLGEAIGKPRQTVIRGGYTDAVMRMLGGSQLAGFDVDVKLANNGLVRDSLHGYDADEKDQL
ncbi:MAG: hypothetical protein WCH04_15695 [Gammaproteobacteria bacterium]